MNLRERKSPFMRVFFFCCLLGTVFVARAVQKDFPNLKTLYTPSPSEKNLSKWEPKVGVTHEWTGASFDGRSLWIWDDVVFAKFGEKLKLWHGWDRSFAKGKTTSRFENAAHRYGIKLAAFKLHESELILKYQAYRMGDGRATSENSAVTFSGPIVDQFDVKYRWAGVHFGRVASLKSKAYTLGAKAFCPIKSIGNLRSELKTALFYEWSPNVPGFKRRCKADLEGALVYKASNFLETGLRLHVAPLGLPIEGTSLTPVTAYEIFGIGGVVGTMKNKPIGFLSFFLTLKTP